MDRRIILENSFAESMTTEFSMIIIANF